MIKTIRNFLAASTLLFALNPLLSAQSDTSFEGTPYSIGLFAGVQGWALLQEKNPQTPDKLVPGWGAGIRADQDFKQHFGVEEAWTIYGVNNVRFHLVPGTPVTTVGFGARNGQVFIGPLFYLTPPSSRVRPFLTIGPGFEYFWMAHGAKAEGREN